MNLHGRKLLRFAAHKLVLVDEFFRPIQPLASALCNTEIDKVSKRVTEYRVSQELPGRRSSARNVWH